MPSEQSTYPIPTGDLQLECFMSGPPRPMGFCVRVNGKPVATLSIETVQKAFAKLDEVSKEWHGRMERFK